MVDSGSSNSLITERMAREIEDQDKNSWWSRKTYPTNLRSFTNTPIKNKGTMYCDVQCNGWNARRADLIVIPNNHRALIGRDLFQGLGIQINQQSSPNSEGKNVALIEIRSSKNLKQEIAKHFPGLIKRIGRSINHTVKSKFKTNFTPVHQRGRRVPIHLQKQVEEELKKLQDNGNIIKLDKCSDKNFISPMVITVKRDKTIKLAMDSKIINKAIHKNKFQMQNIDCLMDNIAQSISESSHEGEVLFSAIDLRYAYSQPPLDEAKAKQFNFDIVGGQATGTYRFITGFYGLMDMPAEFQKAIDNTLKSFKDTYGFLDDIIIVSGGGIKCHKEKVFKCLQNLDRENLSLNLEKCNFAKNEIDWLGFAINQNGIKPLVSKTEAIQNLKAPNICKQLNSFLGSVHHLKKFVPNLAIQCRVFRDLKKKDNKYHWEQKHQIAFESIKLHIKNIRENTHYDSTRKTRVRTYATRSGLGAVREHESNKEWETIAHASRFLNKAEEKYSINELELLGVVWALEHFKHYLYGQSFTVQTDHRALLSLLKDKSTKAHQSRLTCWCDILIPFHFQI